MEITTDITLRGIAWHQAVEHLENIFKNRTNYSIFLLSLAIGLMYDQRIEQPTDDPDSPAPIQYVPRNVITNNDNGKLDYMFQAAILSTRTESYSEQERLEIAFSDTVKFNKIGFLTQFANFGVTKLIEQIGDTDLETMDRIKNFLFATVNGQNLDLYTLPDDVLLD